MPFGVIGPWKSASGVMEDAAAGQTPARIEGENLREAIG
jgi:hypothetical protein